MLQLSDYLTTDPGPYKLVKGRLSSEQEKELKERSRSFLKILDAKTSILIGYTSFHGDNLFGRSSYYNVINDFAQNHGREFSNDRLVTMYTGVCKLPPGDTSDIVIPTPDPDNTSHINRYYLNLAAVGIGHMSIDPNVYNRPPRLLKSDQGPMQNYDSNRVSELAAGIRSNSTQETIMIVQTGSTFVKRYTDKNIAMMARMYREARPNASIIVMSDKIQQTATYESAQSNPLRLGFGFPYDDSAFISELYDLEGKLSGLPGLVDEVVNTGDVNLRCAYFIAADRIISTDSFNAHLAGGAISDLTCQLPSNLTVLHTASNRRNWGVIGARTINGSTLRQYFASTSVSKSCRMPITTEDIAHAVAVSLL